MPPSFKFLRKPKSAHLHQLIVEESLKSFQTPYFYIIHDLLTFEMLFVSDSIYAITGITEEELYTKGEQLLSGLILEDERSHVITFMSLMRNFFYSQEAHTTIGCIPNLRYEIRNLRDRSLHIIQQCELLSIEPGIPKLLISRYIDASWLRKPGEETSIQFFIYDRFTNQIIHKIESVLAKRTLPALTARELQIDALIGKGLTSKEIATKLKLAVSTVQTNRKNIKSKKQNPHVKRIRHSGLL